MKPIAEDYSAINAELRRLGVTMLPVERARKASAPAPDPFIGEAPAPHYVVQLAPSTKNPMAALAVTFNHSTAGTVHAYVAPFDEMAEFLQAAHRPDWENSRFLFITEAALVGLCCKFVGNPKKLAEEQRRLVEEIRRNEEDKSPNFMKLIASSRQGFAKKFTKNEWP